MKREFTAGRDGHVELFIFKSSHNKQPVGYIHSVFTKPEMRHRGIATRLVTEAIEWAKKHDCYKVFLVCKPELSLLYRKTGMTTTGIQMQVIFQ